MPSTQVEPSALDALIDIILKPNAYEYVQENRAEVWQYFQDKSLFSMPDEQGETPFHYVAAKSSIPMAKLLLQQGADVNVLNQNEEAPLFVAMKRFDDENFKEALNWVQFFIEHNCNLNIRNEDGQCPLEYMIGRLINIVTQMPSSMKEQWANDIDIQPLVMLALLTPRSDIDNDVGGEYSNSSLVKFRDFSFASSFSSTPLLEGVMKYLLSAIDYVGFFEVEYFIKKGELNPVIRYLHDMFEDEEYDQDDDADEEGNNLLMLAVSGGHMHIVQYLVKFGFSLRRFNAEGESALILAINTGQVEIFKYLLSQATKEDLRAFKVKELTVLSAALDSRNAEIIGCVTQALTCEDKASYFFQLIDQLKVNQIEAYLRSQLVRSINNEDIAKHRSFIRADHRRNRLLAMQATHPLRYIDERGLNGETALHRLVAFNYHRAIRQQFPGCLFSRHVGYICVTAIGSLTLYHEVMSVFVRHGIDLHALDYQGNTALMISANTPHYLVTKDLISRGIALDAANIHGDTALMIAARAGYVETVGLLVESGADIHKQNRVGKTAFDLAKNKLVLNLLKSVEAKVYHERDPGGDSQPKRMRMG